MSNESIEKVIDVLAFTGNFRPDGEGNYNSEIENLPIPTPGQRGVRKQIARLHHYIAASSSLMMIPTTRMTHTAFRVFESQNPRRTVACNYHPGGRRQCAYYSTAYILDYYALARAERERVRPFAQKYVASCGGNVNEIQIKLLRIMREKHSRAITWDGIKRALFCQPAGYIDVLLHDADTEILMWYAQNGGKLTKKIISRLAAAGVEWAILSDDMIEQTPVLIA